MTERLTILAVPGVGLRPTLFEPFTDRLTAHRSRNGGRADIEILTRPIDLPDFDAQVAFIADRCRREQRVVLVGVSGGATLALACAVEAVDGLVAIVTHEPLIGPLEPTLHRRVDDAGRRLTSEPSEAAALDFLAGLYGSAWSRVPAAAQHWARLKHRVVCAEVAQFASFGPEAERLRVGVPHLTTVGADSGPERHRVASTLRAAGASVRALPRSGHLVLVDRPALFADVVDEFIDHLDLGPDRTDDDLDRQGLNRQRLE